ncbi:hypothetical protein MTO96_039981 [Rhipicephalus appendiculatus]
MGTQIGFVCSDHFLPEDYETNLNILRSLGFDTKNARLKRDAVPTQNLSLGAPPRKRRRSERASSPVVSDASDSEEEEEDNAANGSEYFPSFNDTSLE